MLHQMIKIHLKNLKKIDNAIGTDYLRTYKRTSWFIMNEIEKPVMKCIFTNGRGWRRMKDKFLTLEERSK